MWILQVRPPMERPIDRLPFFQSPAGVRMHQHGHGVQQQDGLAASAIPLARSLRNRLSIIPLFAQRLKCLQITYQLPSSFDNLLRLQPFSHTYSSAFLKAMFSTVTLPHWTGSTGLI